MAELVDALGSGSSSRTWVGVRVPLRALQYMRKCLKHSVFAFFLPHITAIFTYFKTKYTVKYTVIFIQFYHQLVWLTYLISYYPLEQVYH